VNRQSKSIEISRPIGVVFAYLDDVDREHEWQPRLESATKDPPGPSQVGTRKSYVSEFLGRRTENTYVVREMGPGWRIVYATTSDSTVDATSEVECEATSDGTMVTMSVEASPRGALKLIPSAALEKAARDQLAAMLTLLKERLEAV
jgi:carbon monoxide dehydrogenase subunit G